MLQHINTVETQAVYHGVTSLVFNYTLNELENWGDSYATGIFAQQSVVAGRSGLQAGQAHILWVPDASLTSRDISPYFCPCLWFHHTNTCRLATLKPTLLLQMLALAPFAENSRARELDAVSAQHWWMTSCFDEFQVALPDSAADCVKFPKYFSQFF